MSAGAASGRWVLIVDDDPSMLALLTDCLESTGCSVTSASDAMQAAIQAETLRPILVITDMMMPGFGSGADLIKKLRQHPRLKTIPIVVLTAMTPAQARQALPANDPLLRLVFKPFQWPLLLRIIEPVIKAAAQRA